MVATKEATGSAGATGTETTPSHRKHRTRKADSALSLSALPSCASRSSASASPSSRLAYERPPLLPPLPLPSCPNSLLFPWPPSVPSAVWWRLGPQAGAWRALQWRERLRSCSRQRSRLHDSSLCSHVPRLSTSGPRPVSSLALQLPVLFCAALRGRPTREVAQWADQTGGTELDCYVTILDGAGSELELKQRFASPDLPNGRHVTTGDQLSSL